MKFSRARDMALSAYPGWRCFSNQWWAYGSSLNASTSSIAGRAVQADRFRERVVGLQPDRVAATGGRPLLQLREQAATDAEAAGVRGDPHPLELGRLGAVELERSRADRLTVQCARRGTARLGARISSSSAGGWPPGRSRRRSVGRARRSTGASSAGRDGGEGSTASTTTRAAVSSSSTWCIAATKRSRCGSVSGSRKSGPGRRCDGRARRARQRPPSSGGRCAPAGRRRWHRR